MSTYLALLDGGAREEAVEVRRTRPGVYEVRLRGKVHVVDACRHDAGTLSLLVDQASYGATLDWRDRKVTVRLRGAAVALELLDERALRSRRPPAARNGGGRRAVVAGLAGRVLAVLVREGDPVRAGQAVAVVSALGMENEVRSPGDGRVVAVHAREGQAVAADETLCAVE